MDSLGPFILGMEILLLLAGWILFQQAKSDLTARAAQMPVVAEIKALQKSIAQLIEQLKLESVQVSAQMEARCIEARELLAALDRRLDEVPAAPAARGARRRVAPSEPVPTRIPAPEPVREPEPPMTRATNPKYQEVYGLTDEGVAPAEIAHRTGLSEGEVELILGLRAQSV